MMKRSSAMSLFSAAGAALLVAQALLPAMPSDAAHQVAAGTAHRAAVTGSAAAFLLAGVMFVLGVCAGGGVLVERGRTLTRIGLVLTAIGALWPAVGRAAFNAILVAVSGSSDHASAVSAMHAVGSSAAFALFLPLLVAFVVGPVLLAVGLRRASALPIWPALLWFAGVLVVNAAESSSRAAAVIGMALVAVSIGWIGRGITAASTGAAEAVQPRDLVPAN